MFMVNSSSLCSVGCEFSKGGGFAIGAMLSYFFAGCLLCVAPNPEPDEEFSPPPAAAGQERVTIERTEHADGTVAVKKTTTHPDGSKTVEETTEQSPDVEAQGSKMMEQPADNVVEGEPVDTRLDVEAQESKTMQQPADNVVEAEPVDTSNIVDACRQRLSKMACCL
jgi:hypothetical protein